MTILSLLLALASFALLGIATDGHYQRRFGHRLPATRRQRLRMAAWLALAASTAPAIAAAGWIFGPVIWSGLVMLAAGAVFLVLNLMPALGR